MYHNISKLLAFNNIFQLTNHHLIKYTLPQILIEDQFSSRMSDDKTLEDGVTVYYHDSYVSKVGSCVTEHLSDLG